MVWGNEAYLLLTNSTTSLPSWGTENNISSSRFFFPSLLFFFGPGDRWMEVAAIAIQLAAAVLTKSTLLAS